MSVVAGDAKVLRRRFRNLEQILPTTDCVIMLTEPAQGDVQFAYVEFLAPRCDRSIEKAMGFRPLSHPFGQVHVAGLLFRSRRSQMG